MIHFLKILWWIESSKEEHVFEIEIICKIINVFMVFFVKINACNLIEVLILKTNLPNFTNNAKTIMQKNNHNDRMQNSYVFF